MEHDGRIDVHDLVQTVLPKAWNDPVDFVDGSRKSFQQVGCGAPGDDVPVRPMVLVLDPPQAVGVHELVYGEV